MARRWQDWPKNFGREANIANGLVGIGGLGIAGTSVLLTGPLAPVAAAVGIGVAIAAGAWCAVKAIPRALKKPQELVGGIIDDLSILDDINGTMTKVGLIGLSRVGKTTLIENLFQIRNVNRRTEDPYATVMRIDTPAPAFVAFVDAAGQQYVQQFEVIATCEHVIVIVDHSAADSEEEIERRRQTSHREFLAQLLAHMKRKGRYPSHVHFLFNKRDLWEGGSDDHRLRKFFSDEIAKWNPFNIKITNAVHSNREVADIAALKAVLRTWVT